MTPEEREEYIFDLACHYLDSKPQSYVWSLALDKLIEQLEKKSDAELAAIAPPNLLRQDKKKRSSKKPSGF
jgi:hypothetical protein